MKNPISALLLQMLTASVSANEVVDGTEQSLDAWEPLSVEVRGDVLTVIGKEQRVTDDIY